MRRSLGLWCLAFGLAFVHAVAADENSDPDTSGRDYVIGIADTLRVVVWGEPELSLSVRVRPDGKITVPLINDVAVSGMTAAQVRETIAERLSAFVREPNVTVIVEEINSYRVFVLGEVNRQGALAFHRPVRLLEAIAEAGGLTQFSKKEITVLRHAGPTQKRILVDYKRLWRDSTSEWNIFLMPGDTLLVD